jgi:DedD protein
VGVLGFPLLFETQPRPIPVDIPIEIPRKEGAPSLPLPPPRNASTAPANARVASGVISERSAEPKREATSAALTTAPRNDAPPPRSESPPRSEAAASSAPTPKPAPKPQLPSDDGGRARALLEGQSPAASGVVATAPTKPATVVAAVDAGKSDANAAKPEPSKPDAANGRFVVQVGAYGEAASARDMRQRVDKLGLKSYTQVVAVDGARRIRLRVGPFAAREDAEKAAGTLKAAGLPAAVLTL